MREMNGSECKCKGLNLLWTISAIVGFLGMAFVLFSWLLKKYKKCTAVFNDDGSTDCHCTCAED